MATVLQYARFSALVYQPDGGTDQDVQATIGSDWRRFLSAEEGPGYFGAAYFNTVTRELVIVHRGLQLDSQSDWRNGLQASQAKLPDQMSAAQGFYANVLAELTVEGITPSSIVHTGHSLGGGLANLMAVTTGQSAYGFNAIGVRDSLQQYGGAPDVDYSDRITNISSWFDPANTVGTKIGDVKYIFLSSIPLVPDFLEPLLALLSMKFVGLAGISAYLLDQHLIATMVATIDGLPLGQIDSVSTDLQVGIDGTLSGGYATQWSDLEAAVASTPALAALIAETEFSRIPNLIASQIRLGQRAALASPDVDWPKKGYWAGLTYVAFYRELFPGITYIKFDAPCGLFAAGKGKQPPQLLIERVGGKDYGRIIKPDPSDFLKLDIPTAFYEATVDSAERAWHRTREAIVRGLKK